MNGAGDDRWGDSGPLGERTSARTVENAAALVRAPRTSPRPAVVADPLYGAIHLSWWAAALVATPPFQRIAGISLSDVPGEWLFHRPFPSRLDHSFGVYHLVRLARPRDRTLQAAALAHDLGHGPFSHLCEPLMRERLGVRHEERSAALVDEVRAALPASIARRMDWLDWDEVAAFVQGEGDRGALLAGRLDFDNAEYVARFLLAGGICTPRYDPATLARALRPLPAAQFAVWAGGRPLPGASGTNGQRRARSSTVYLVADAQDEAELWQADRAAMYSFLHEGHQNVTIHAMLRKALDLAAGADLLPDTFFDLSDEAAYQLLVSSRLPGVSALAQAARAGQVYQCVWEAEASPRHEGLRELFAQRRERLALEERLAAEAGLAAQDVIVESVISGANRALPPLAPLGHPEHLVWLPEPMPAPQRIHVLVAPEAGPDYLRRLRLATERHFNALGVAERRETTAPAERLAGHS